MCGGPRTHGMLARRQTIEMVYTDERSGDARDAARERRVDEGRRSSRYYEWTRRGWGMVAEEIDVGA